MKKILATLAIVGLSVLPVVAMAAAPNTPPTKTWVELIAIIKTISYSVFLVLALVMFIYSAFMFLMSGGDAEKLKSARGMLIWAVVAVLIALMSYSMMTILTGWF